MARVRVCAPVLYPTKPCKRTDMTETLYATQQVRVLPGQGWPPMRLIASIGSAVANIQRLSEHFEYVAGEADCRPVGD